MTYQYVDAHAHISDLRIQRDVAGLVARLKKQGLCHVIMGGVNPADWKVQQDLVTSFSDFVSPVFGIHPWTVVQASDQELEAMIVNLEVVAHQALALGEIGLDFSKSKEPDSRQRQAVWVERQFSLAQILSKKVVIHCVRGHDVMLGILNRFPAVTGLIHSWRGSDVDGKKYLKRGFLLSISPKSIRGLDPVDLSWIPENGFTIESDFPYFEADGSLAGADAWTAALHEVAEFMAVSLDQSVEQVLDKSTTNVCRLFGMNFNFG